MARSLNNNKELLCFNAEKVYDWVVLQETVNQNVSAEDIGALTIDPCGPTVSDLSTRCYLIDPLTGNPLPQNAEIEVTETAERQDRDFLIDGQEVELQRVSFEKTLSLVVEFTGFDGVTPFLELSDPIEIEIPESVYLCAPEGTRLVVRISEVTCSATVNCDNTELESVDLTLNVCQSVQAVADVTLELEASFCEPRDLLAIDECQTPIVPQQCPTVFPGNAKPCPTKK
ncbi:hypothetical protein SAMN05421734_104163 [Pelagirhabdus alkalitolerans]|uniref:SipL SPOCS domain-containing protein n=1 Tax=Pelagirhabdus alkalitolerans TaxID=1612202 RepID=A0A1G6IWV4_9BACI|nr:hypothetical protein [Pelagirhabdus alkalitolerans]SDC11052.1 hypothetical protein SAMN05421734_104163 [Pelagirhabdus alkalitolerans]